MPFQTSVIFGVSRTEGASATLRQIQTNAAAVVFAGDWGGNSGAVTLTNTETNALHIPFVLENGVVNPAGTTTTAELKFDWEKYYDLSGAQRIALANLFQTGGSVVLDVDLSDGTNTSSGTLTVQLRSLKTSDFRVDPAGPTAVPAHHPSVAAGTDNNPVGTGTFAYTFPAALGGGAVVPVAGTGALPLAGTPPHPVAGSPNPVSDLVLTIVTTIGGTPRTSLLKLDLHFPTKIIVLVDRSGSMGALTTGSTSKWDAARAAANLFSTLHGEAINDLSTPNGVVKDAYQILLGRFTSDAGFSLTYAPPGALMTASTKPQLGVEVPLGGTPIGQALMTAKPLLGTGAWERRHLILLTDGMDNSNVAGQSLVDIDASATALPLLSGNKAGGIVVHTISYALAGDTQVVNLHNLASVRGGKFLGSESDADELDPALLRQKFIDILGTIIPVERLDGAGGVDNNRFTIEDGVERVIFVAPIGTPIAAHLVADPTITTTGPAQANGLSWAVANSPPPGLWEMTGGGSGAKLALVDLSLRMQCSVVPAGLGRPIKIQAVIKHSGLPVSGSDVRVAVRRPGESIGETITTFIQSGGLVKAIRRGQVSQTLTSKEFGTLIATSATAVAPKGGERANAGVTTAATVAVGVPSQGADTKSLQRLLLEAAERSRNLALQKAGTPITLLEVEPGVYEAELPASLTQEEGVYSFHYRADGVTPGAQLFARNQTCSTVLVPTPDPKYSDVSVVLSAVGASTIWTATVLPRTATKRALGPGLGYALAFHYVDPALRKKLEPPITIDNIDGTYSTRLQLDKDQAVPEIGLYFGSPDSEDAEPLLVRDNKVRQVKVVVHQIQVLDDKDSLFKGAGELVFKAVVAPNGSRARAVTTRLPRKDNYVAKSGQILDIQEVIYEGPVESGAALVVSITGEELDWPACFNTNDPLTRYLRRIPVPAQTKHYSPGDEPHDPESMTDWKVWYTVEVK